MRRSVHPHGCGDNVRHCPVCQWRRAGSPPRVWGQPEKKGSVMGKRSGSPPRVWGQPVFFTLEEFKQDWFTPTGVGTTLRFLPILVGFDQQHPFYVY